jgi:hypothetical protein
MFIDGKQIKLQIWDTVRRLDATWRNLSIPASTGRRHCG